MNEQQAREANAPTTRELADRLADYARRLQDGDLLEGAGLAEDLADAAEMLRAAAASE